MEFHENVLKKLHKSSILVTDIANQFWCERQMELNYLFGKKETYAMRKGSQMHEELQEEIYIPLIVEPVTYEDYMYKTGYENYMSLRTLRTTGLCRELRLYGSLNGYRISGKIDELKMVDGKVVVKEVKTVDQNTKELNSVKTKPHSIQVMLYRKLLDDLKTKKYTGMNFEASYKISKMKISDTFQREILALGIKNEYASIQEIFKLMFNELYALPEISNVMELSYIDRFNGKERFNVKLNYDEQAASRDIIYAMHYWNGERESVPVQEQEKWKCNVCKFFGKECTVWWNK
jgi:CRISPR/Cas system-associated exonuclease Cas4 (RecB family)